MSYADTPKKRSKIPLIFVAFFAVVLTANGIMIYIASSTWTGLETESHYIKGLNYNAALEGAKVQEERGWTSSVVVDEGEGLTAHISVALQAKDGRALSGADFKVRLVRPTHAGHDRGVTLVETKPGQYEADVTFPLAGQWDIRQIVTHREGNYQAVERVIVGLRDE